MVRIHSPRPTFNWARSPCTAAIGKNAASPLTAALPTAASKTTTAAVNVSTVYVLRSRLVNVL